MKTSNNLHSESLNFELDQFNRQSEMLSSTEQDNPAIESLMDSMHGNPLGRLLEVISMLPEVRTEKVIRARQNIEHSDMFSDTRMDIALDRILEEIVVED